MDIQTYVNKEEGMSRVLNNAKIYRKMLDMFLNSTEFQVLEDAFVSGDYKKGEAASHSIKGVAGNLSFPVLFKESNTLMEQYRGEGPKEETIAAYRDALTNTIVAVKELIVQMDNA